MYLPCVIYLLTFLVKWCWSSQYVAPGECSWTHVSTSNFDVSLECNMKSNNPSGLNFSLIQIDHTISLTLICDANNLDFKLANSSLSHLKYLRSFTVEGCKLSYLNGNSLYGLDQLKNLTFRTLAPSWSHFSLHLNHESFVHLKKIELLNLGFNNMARLPEDLFCPLSSLKVLNLTHNKLTSFGSLGVVDETTGHLCLQKLEKLDMSYNSLTKLYQAGVASLKHIHSLYLQHNQIIEVAEISLSALSRLEIIDLSSNRLRSLPSKTFHRSGELKQLYLQNNSLTLIEPELFKELSKLEILNLSYNLVSSESINSKTFVDLIRVVILDLSYNQLTKINSTFFQAQYSLQILYLNNNFIDAIDDSSFSAVYNLHTLILSHNRLKTLPMYTLNGLSLIRLALDNNEIASLEENCFKNCTKLKIVNLSGNRLKNVPAPLSDLHSLRNLDLSRNFLKELRNSSWMTSTSLMYLSFSNNQISNVSLGYFHDVFSLTRLDLSHNRISRLETGIFENATRLMSIHLENNELLDINGLFMNLDHLRYLNVSCNNITWFDFALLPRGLIELDIHSNFIDLIDNFYDKSDSELRRMDFSYNHLNEIGPTSIPNKIEVLLLNNNNISCIHPLTFVGKMNLSYVDLQNNRLTNLDNRGFSNKGDGESDAAFRVSNNPFVCDCEMEWLQRLREGSSPRIIDLDKVTCKLPFVRGGPELELMKVKSSSFLCRYKTHCFAVCHCCDFDACDCEMMCPDNCNCYYDSTWNTNIVDCSRSNIKNVPTRVPMDVTELYLDGNELISLTSHTFIGRKNMRSLYLNNSGISSINNRTFNGLHMLERLHLEYNHLIALNGFEFDRLERLKELYLHHNRIGVVNNRTFSGLISLEVLHLEYNAIVTIDVNSLNRNKRLNKIYLGYNLWSCGCEFVEDMVNWMKDGLVKDVASVRCYHNITSLGYILMKMDSKGCGNSLSKEQRHKKEPERMSLFPDSIFSENWGLMILVIIVILISLLTLGIVWTKRETIRDVISNALLRRSRYMPESEKLFDAFVSYSRKDESFISTRLAPELECGPIPYRLCLRYRDLPVSGYVAEAIGEAIGSSHRTIVLMSEQYLRSDCCLYELKMAFAEAASCKEHGLVVVLLDKGSGELLDSDARMILSSVPVIPYDDRRFWEKLKAAMPPRRGKDFRGSFDFKRGNAV